MAQQFTQHQLKQKSFKRQPCATLNKLAQHLGVTGRKRVAYACAAVFVVSACVGITMLSANPSVLVKQSDTDALGYEVDTTASSDTQGGDASETEQEIPLVVVHVDGAVNTPGVYRLQGDNLRVQDAIEAAGGLRDDADTTLLNLASVLIDGTKIYVPQEGEDTTAILSNGATTSSANAGTAQSGTGLININTATSEELQELPGIGPSTAAAIIEDRETNGAFTSTEDLMRVSGIGEKKYAKVEGLICV